MVPQDFCADQTLRARTSSLRAFVAGVIGVLLLPLATHAVDTTTVFNEVMFHPVAADDAEWIELHNEMAVNMDLSGWRITGGVNFTFPAGTTIAAGGYMVVSSNPAALQARAGITGVLGPWIGSLDNGSETVTLRNAIAREMDEFHFEDSGRFPVAADGGGVSLAKRAPQLATGDPESWTFSGKIGGTPGAENFPTGPIYGPATTLTAFGDAWNFNQTGANLGGAWAQTAYTAGNGGWQSGPGVFAFKSDPVAVPVGTVLADPGTTIVTHYFQRAFNFSGDPARTELQLTTLIDDGAVVFLNGVEVTRINMPGGAVDGATRAATELNNAAVSEPVTLPTANLVQGANVLSVSVHREPAVAGNGTGLTLAPANGFTLTWDRVSGAFLGKPVPENFARASAGATPFGSSALGGNYTIPHINDGAYGNPNSWVSAGGTNQFVGVKFASTRAFSRIAWGRDNTGAQGDRAAGTYTWQFTSVANPGVSTPDTQDATTGWRTLGAATLAASNASYQAARRHEITVAPAAGGLVNATGVRVIVSDPSLCIDEIEIAGAPQNDVVFGAQLAAREILPPPNAPVVLINEIGGSTDSVWRVELRNISGASVDVGGLVLAASNAPAGYVLPAQALAPGALLVLDETQLGFRPRLDDRIFLYKADRTALFDAAPVRPTVRARDGSRFFTPTAATFGNANTFAFQSGVVINELMYHFAPNSSAGAAPVTDNPEEWIELHNRTAAAIDLSGWQLDDAVEFTFPQGASIPAGGYLVIAKDRAALAAKWPDRAAAMIGDFSGKLANGGERLVLKDALGNPANEIRYFNGGAWSSLPDGGGASLELRDPRADNANGAAWAASDESGDTAWQTVTYRMLGNQAYGQTQWNEFRIGMLTDGECLVDDVSVIRDPDGARQQLIQGGDFPTLTNKWRLLGNHGTSAIEPEPGNAGNPVLHVRATGAFGFNHNHIETTFVNNTAIASGTLYEVSFRARWLSGSNQLNTRAYYSRLAKTTELEMPVQIGTPGAPNSRNASNIGPTMTELAHTPVIPAVNAPVTVTVRATDPDNVSAMTLRSAVNGVAPFAAVPMSNAGGSLYTATLPGQTAGKIVQFYIEAQDALGAAAYMPAGGPSSRALYIVQDGQGTTLSAHELRIIMLPAERDVLLAINTRLSDARIGGTAIYRRSEVFYDAGVRLQGSAAGRIWYGEAYPGYDVSFPAEHLFRGVHDSVNIDRSGRAPVIRGQDEIYVKHMFHRARMPGSYDDLCYVIAPANMHTGTAILQMGGLKESFVESQYGDDGSVFTLDGTYESGATVDGNPESIKNGSNIQQPQIWAEFTNLGNDKEQYRAPLDIRVGRRRDDYTGLIAFSQTMALPATQLAQQIGARMDVDEWMRVTALYSLCGINDCYMTNTLNHNLRVYVPPDGLKVKALPWDMDFVFDLPASSAAILAGYNLRRVVNIPPNTRLYYGHIHDLCNTVFRSDYMTPWLAHYGAVVGQNMSVRSSYIDARRASVLSQLPAQVPFAITTNGGAPFTVNTSTATLEGNGWINIRKLRRADTGAVLPTEWTALTKWRTTVALQYGENPITIEAYDFTGAPLASASITITSTLPAAPSRDFLRVSELHYHPLGPAGAELNATTDKDDFEFIELRNIGAQPLDISGCAFTAGVDFVFPANTMLAANEIILLVRNTAAFGARYGAGARVAGAYGPADSLSNSGELVTLVDATGATIQSFTYRDTLPWPTTPDGQGPSLVAIAPHVPHDRNDPANWRASTAPGGNPGAADATTFTGSPTADADGDGASAFLEYALGTSDSAPASSPATAPVSLDQTGMIFTFTRRLSADDVAYAVEGSSDLFTWSRATTELVSRIGSGDSVIEAHRVISPVPPPLRLFLRLRATAR